MKDKIISFILTIIIVSILSIIGYIGYMVYTEIAQDGTIQVNFESNTGFPIIEYIPNTKETIDQILNTDIFDGVNGGTTQVNSNIISTTKESRYFYEQLDDTAKAIYKKLYQNKDNLKTGTYTVEFENAFYQLLSKNDGDEILKNDYQSAIEALVYENPDLFFLDVTKMYINIEKITKITGVKYNVFIDSGDEINYLIEGLYSKEDVEKYESQIEEVKQKIIYNLQNKSDYEKIKIVHDYLIDTISYESNLSQNHIYNIYGAFINKKCVCEGYAKAFQYLMNEIGIENIIVIGTGTNSKNETENHAWNYVKLNGKWYAVDVTWDDPIILGGGTLTYKARYQYFLKGSKTMETNHFPVGHFTKGGKEFSYPILSENDYN